MTYPQDDQTTLLKMEIGCHSFIEKFLENLPMGTITQDRQRCRGRSHYERGVLPR